MDVDFKRRLLAGVVSFGKTLDIQFHYLQKLTDSSSWSLWRLSEPGGDYENALERTCHWSGPRSVSGAFSSNIYMWTDVEKDHINVMGTELLWCIWYFLIWLLIVFYKEYYTQQESLDMMIILSVRKVPINKLTTSKSKPVSSAQLF